jgi:Cu(I)/Ag(I) efflux system periplasmic protein CusF
MEIDMKSASFPVVLLGIALMLPVQAQMSAPHAHGAPTAKATSSEVYEGQVKRVSKDTGRVTLAHGPLKAFDMPPMTMAFQVKDAKQLAPLKEGDKVKFALEQAGDNLVITRIEPLK